MRGAGADDDQPYTLFVNQTEYGVVLVFMEALELDPPLTLVCSNLHLQLEGYPIEQGLEIDIPLLPPGKSWGSQGLWLTSWLSTP